MKAALLKAFGQALVIEEVPDPQVGPDEVLIRVMACGIDGTDLKMLDGFGYTPELPFIMGHEPAGVIEQVGSAVADLCVGDRVVSYNFGTARQIGVSCASTSGGEGDEGTELQLEFAAPTAHRAGDRGAGRTRL